MLHQASCHCRAVAYEVEADFTEALECNCSHCSRKGYLLAFVLRDKLRLTTSPDGLAVYRFNRHVIDHYFCPNCGCAPFGEGKGPDGSATAAINLRCVTTIDLAAIKRIPVDGRSR
jgi:hypothetical protein